MIAKKINKAYGKTFDDAKEEILSKGKREDLQNLRKVASKCCILEERKKS